jgi:CubicO group peptidase (beta-lactamase class C family)
MILAFPGMVRTTGRDLVAWDRALASNAVLGPAAQAKLLTPHMDMLTAEAQAKTPTLLGYGYGMMIVCDHDRVIHGHGGAMAGFNSFFARIPDQGWAVVVLADTDGFDTRSIGKPILQMILTARPAVPEVNTERPCRRASYSSLAAPP